MSQSKSKTMEGTTRSKKGAKRTADEAGMDAEQEYRPIKKSCLLPGEEPTGHYCAVCQDMIHVSECVKMFVGCGHMFHHRCTCYGEMKRCPLCQLDVTEASPARSIMFRVAKVLASLTTPQRMDLLNKAQREKVTLAKMTFDKFYETVNLMVYHNTLPKNIDVTVSVGRYMIDDFVFMPKNESPTVYVYLREKGTHIQNQWELYRVMWCMYMRTHSIREVDHMFVNMTLFEDFYN